MKFLAFVIVTLISIFSSDAPAAEPVPSMQAAPTVTVEVAATTTPEPTPEPFVIADAELAGAWAGSWEIFSAGGDWAELENFSWDCWGEMSEGDALYLWDVDLDKDIGLANLVLEREEDGLRVTEGWFMDCETGFENWRGELEKDEEGLLLTLRGSYASDYSGEFSFVVSLRPEN